MLDRLAGRVLSERRLRGEPAILRGTREVATLREVHRELARDLGGARTVGTVEAIADAKVQPDATAGRNPCIEHGPVERVNERETRGDGPIRPFGRARGAQDPPAS